MKITADAYPEILRELKELEEKGFTHVAYQKDGFPVSRTEEVGVFRRAYDASEYCYESSTDLDQFFSHAIAPLCVAMEMGAEKPMVTQARDGVIDLMEVVWDFYENDYRKNTLNSRIMNEKNFDYLKDQVKFTGFGEGLEGELRRNMEQRKEGFTMNHEAYYGERKITADLQFRKSNQTDMYFFNSYKVQVQKEGQEPGPEQTFYINKGNNITLKEAFNMMEGRAVNKELTDRQGEKYNAWLQLDFKNTDDKGNFKMHQYHENYGFKLEEALGKHPIKELGRDDYKENLMDSLKKGNLQSATFVKDGQEIKQFIEASPQFKTINVYDDTMQRVNQRQGQDNKQEQGQSKKEGQKQAGSDEGEGTPAKSRRKSQSHSM